MELDRRFAGTATCTRTIVTGRRKDGREVSGVEAVLLNVRTDQILCFRYSDAGEDQVVFVS